MTSILIQENISLQEYNTLAVPATTRWFVCVENQQQLIEALNFRQQQQCELLVLGGGSNVVLADTFPGLCLHIKLRGITIVKENSDQILLSIAAGENWHETVMHCVKQGYYGIENLALIPGSVGAAPIQNIGAYGVELEQCFHSLEAIDIESGETIILNKKECLFAYRDSIFKHQLQDKMVITKVLLALSKLSSWCLEYPALKNQLAQYERSQLSAAMIADAVIAMRQSKLPDPQIIPNAGSFFKNPIVNHKTYQQLQQQYPNIIAYPQHNNCYKLAAGWLLDNAGWRGKEVGGFSMHEQQALVLTNPGKLSAKKLLEFVAQVKQDIHAKYALELEVEPRIFYQTQ